ncbi:MAG: hypothetical protein ABIA63_04345 [bacterium]
MGHHLLGAANIASDVDFGGYDITGPGRIAVPHHVYIIRNIRIYNPAGHRKLMDNHHKNTAHME